MKFAFFNLPLFFLMGSYLKWDCTARDNSGDVRSEKLTRSC